MKGVASIKLARDLGTSEKSTWHLGHRIRAAFVNDQDRLMLGPIEVDETNIGGKAKNQHASQRDGKRGVGGKYLVVGVLDRANGEPALRSRRRHEKRRVIGLSGRVCPGRGPHQ